MTQKDIKSVLLEERTFAPPAAFKKRANIGADDLKRMHAKAAEDYVGFWSELAALDIDARFAAEAKASGADCHKSILPSPSPSVAYLKKVVGVNWV